MDLFIPGGRFHWRDHRFYALTKAGCRGSQALSADGVVASGQSATAGNQCGRACRLSASDPGVESQWGTGAAVPMSPNAVPEQCAGAGSPIPQAANGGQPVVPFNRWGTANHCGV